MLSSDKADVEQYLLKVEEEKKKSCGSSLYTKLKEFSTAHVQHIVHDIIRQYALDPEKWSLKLLEFVKTAVENVKPSSRLLNDPLNFNNFIKIKIINWRDNSKSAYINGIVMSKNVADKRMRGEIKEPSILLLKDSLVGSVKKGEEKGLFTDIECLVEQEDHWVEIIKQKLTLVKPSLIIVEKDVGYKVLDALREEDVTVITNMSPKKMKRMARYT